MLENWCWEPTSLRIMSGHVDDHAKKLPDELLTKLIKAKDANVALLTKRQVRRAASALHLALEFILISSRCNSRPLFPDRRTDHVWTL
jgi:Zn-dependent oligopeptidase